MLFAHTAQFRAKDGGLGRNLKARHLRNLRGGLADALRIHRPVRSDQQFAESLLLGVVAEIRMVGFQEAEDAVAYGRLGYDGLFARTDRAIIERLAGDDLRDG